MIEFEMQKIIVPRSVAVTSMAYVIKDIYKKYGSQIDVYIITRPENDYAMREINGISGVIHFNGSVFDHKYLRQEEIEKLRAYNFDLAVIPINRAKHSYANVIDFCNRAFGNIDLYYYSFDYQEFYHHKKSIIFNFYKLLLKIISGLVAVLLTILYLFIMGFRAYKQKLIHASKRGKKTI